MNYKNHPASELFPMMPAPELKELADDIKAKGLIHPIILLHEQVLDGRNRLKACGMADVQPRFEIYSDERSPVEYVLSANLKRRNLEKSQCAAIATNALPMLEAEAKERQTKNLRKGQQLPVEEQMPERESGRARDKAAELVGVSPRYVSDAKAIKHADPKVFQQVLSGEKTIPEARREVLPKWSPGGESKTPRDHAPEDDEPDTLFTLKRYFKKASKKVRKQFLKWATAYKG